MGFVAVDTRFHVCGYITCKYILPITSVGFKYSIPVSYTRLDRNTIMAKIIRIPSEPQKNTREDLELLDKSALIDRIIKLDTHNKQLLTVIEKGTNPKPRKSAKKAKKPFDFTKCHKRHILLKLYYLGWEYNGFSLQEDTNNTIERHLFDALLRGCFIESRETSNYNRCGRTDKGVSSFSQVISLDIRSKLEPKQQSNLSKELPYCLILNKLLPASIRCIGWCPAPSDFSARFDCSYRKYKYFFPRGNLDIDAMDKAVKYTIGTYDFRNICKMDVAHGVTNFIRNVLDAKVIVSNQPMEKLTGYDMCELEVTSRGFLWHQIRCLMGILLLVGQKNEEPEIILKLLDIETCPRRPQYSLAHEVPLSLWYSEYKDIEWEIDENELIYTIKVLQKDWALSTIKSTMMRGMLSELENLVSSSDTSFQTNCLLLGVKSKKYRPLMKRQMCQSLENKIKYYERKGILKTVHSDDV